MAIIAENIKLAYIPAPKIACTSLKLMFYRVENGRDFESSVRNGSHYSIHNYYPSIPFPNNPHERLKKFRKVCVVRDPVSRFISSYTNRVIFHKELDKSRLSLKAIIAGAKPNPSLEDYVERIEIYRKHSQSIRHHTDSQVAYYGDKRRYYDKIYKMSELEKFRSDVSEILRENLDLTHSQSGGPKISKDELSPSAIDKIQKMYSEDYDVFRDF